MNYEEFCSRVAKAGRYGMAYPRTYVDENHGRRVLCNHKDVPPKSNPRWGNFSCAVCGESKFALSTAYTQMYSVKPRKTVCFSACNECAEFLEGGYPTSLMRKMDFLLESCPLCQGTACSTCYWSGFIPKDGSKFEKEWLSLCSRDHRLNKAALADKKRKEKK